ncbi:MAG: TonB-dependent receptor [Steroidobacteraceae bacterium]|nr:TonB-dependent receptor [Steroidobacteraceae bacterium]
MYDTNNKLRRAISLALAIPCAFGAAVAVAQKADESDSMEEIVILGRGETRQVLEVGSQQIDLLPAGTSALKAIEKLPGVNFQSADPFGAYEWSARVTIRGFNQNRIGFTLDGVPLGDMTYGNHNGLHISRAIPSELVDRVVLSQGTGGLDTASSSNLGGTVQFFSAAPADEFGANLQQMFGSDSARRTFARLDTGELGAGTKILFTAVDASSEKWKGAGDQNVRDYNLKLVQPLGGATLTAFYNYSDRMEIDYQDLSIDIVDRRGRDWDNFYPNWDAAVAAAQACNASGQNDAIACDDAYWNASGLRKDHLGYVALALPFGENVEWNANVYMHQNEGQGLWGTPYTPTPGGAPLSIRTTEYDLERQGIVTSVTWKVGAHEINGGIWFESNDFVQARRFYGETSLTAPSRSYEDFQRNPLLTQWEYDFDTTTRVFHLQDTWAISDSLRLNAGFRAVRSENEATTIVGPVKTGTLETDEPFLPQVGINWRVSGDLELFASGSRNVRTFASSGTSGPFSTTAAGFAAIRDVIEPETATNLEAGVRVRSAQFEGLLAVYHVDFEDRLVGITQGPGIVGNPSVLANVGGVTTKGIEAALTWRPADGLSWFNSVSYNDSTYDDDYVTTNGAGVQTIVPVGGKKVVDTPELLFKSEVGYQRGPFFAHVDANHVDDRYYTYLNEGGVDAYTVFNAGFGYRFTGLGFVEQLTLQADVTNLSDEDYFSTIDSNGFSNSDPNGTVQTLLLGAPRQYFLSLKAKF